MAKIEMMQEGRLKRWSRLKRDSATERTALAPETPAATDSPEVPKPAEPGPSPGKPAFAGPVPGSLIPGMVGLGSSRTDSPRSERNLSARLSSSGVRVLLLGL